ncbi:MAG: TIGR00725 family protein [Thermodesulfobacteriota bacterium]
MRKLIAVVGGGDEDPVRDILAEQVGRLIAQADCALVNGGLGGVMRACAKGAREAGGLTFGLLPGSRSSDANEFIEVAVPTGLGEMRNALIVRAAAAVIAIGGGYGTLSEIALALKTGKPVVGLKTWDISPDVLKAASPEEAVRLALEAAS